MGEPLKINLRKIIRDRAGKFIPGFMIAPLERLIHQRELNEVLEAGYPHTGWKFAEDALNYFNISVNVEGMENIPEEGRCVFASNHPLGGLDGIALIALLAKKYGDDGIRFVVNDMLMNVEPLRPVFIPVNKYGSQGRQRAELLNQAYASDMQILQFPAGLVSRLGDDDKIADLKWQKSFVTKAIESDRLIIPVRFIGLNSLRFYKTARWRKKLHIGFNIEQILLPAEVCRSRSKSFRIFFGKPVDPAAIKREGLSPEQIAKRIRDIVYTLEPPETR